MYKIYNRFSEEKPRVLVIGFDFSSLYFYLKENLQDNVMGFVYCLSSPPPVSYFQGPSNELLQVHPLDQLENVIRDQEIQKCQMLIRECPISEVQTIINRIISLGYCSVEFISPKKYSFQSVKSTILITSLAPNIGKSRVSTYFCNVLRNLNVKVSIIIPILEIKSYNGIFSIKKGPYHEIKEKDVIKPNTFSPEDEKLIINFQKAGAYRIYTTSDYEKAIILAERHSDVIIFDSKGCESPPIIVQPPPPLMKRKEKKMLEKFCVFNEESIRNVRKKSLWPGIFNLLNSHNVIFFSNSSIKFDPNDFPVFLQMETNQNKKTPKRKVFYANCVPQEKPSTSSENDTIENYSSCSYESDHSMNFKQNSDYIFIKNPNDLDELVFEDDSSSDKFVDVGNCLKIFLYKYSPLRDFPPLRNHFESQVDILASLSSASSTELRDNNNDAANREAFCRLFLSSHLPPNYRVTSGEIIDSYSNSTSQLDVIIATNDSSVMTIDMTSSVIAPTLADNVLGVVEVKSSLGRDSLKKALTQLRPVKALMPIHDTLKLPDGKVIKDPLDGKIITGIFSFENNKDITKDIWKLISMYPGIVDFIVMPEMSSFFSVEILQVCGIQFDNSKVKNGYVKYTSKGTGLALLYGIFNYFAAVRRFSGTHSISYLGGFWGGLEEKLSKVISEAIPKYNKAISKLSNNADEHQGILFIKDLIHLISSMSLGNSSNSNSNNINNNSSSNSNYKNSNNNNNNMENDSNESEDSIPINLSASNDFNFV